MSASNSRSVSLYLELPAIGLVTQKKRRSHDREVERGDLGGRRESEEDKAEHDKVQKYQDRVVVEIQGRVEGE